MQRNLVGLELMVAVGELPLLCTQAKKAGAKAPARNFLSQRVFLQPDIG